MADLQIIRADERFCTSVDGTTSWHSFSYGRHYDPANISFGPLRAINEEIVAPGAGYEAHHHADTEIVTWVLDGVLEHQDSTGTRGIIEPGTVQRLSAGSGVEHLEHNASKTEPLRFIQMMLAPDAWGSQPEYAAVEVPDDPGWHEAVSVRQSAARLVVGRVGPSEALNLHIDDLAHVHVTRGQVHFQGEVLAEGDCVRIASAGESTLSSTRGAEVLVWYIRHPELPNVGG